VGGPIDFCNSIFIYIIKESIQKFEFLRQPLLGELEMSWREREKKYDL
jgi:hypothetical protein